MRHRLPLHAAIAASILVALPLEAAGPAPGIWEAHVVFGPRARGTLTIAKRGGGWRGEIAGIEAPVEMGRDGVHLVLPGDQGELRASAPAGDAIKGFWIQPAGVVAGVPYAFPVTLRKESPAVWRGRVEPEDDRYDLFLFLTAQQDGSVAAFFRNPQRNDRGGAGRFVAEAREDGIRFADPGNASKTLTGRYDPQQDRIELFWPPLARTLTLSRRDPADEAGAVPLPAGAPDAYRAPLPGNDGWRVESAAASGMDEALLTGLIRSVARSDPTASGAPLVHSLTIAHRGRLVLDEYFFGFDAGRPHDLRSASKTFASVLAGAAMSAGIPVDEETRVLSTLSGLGPVANPDPRKDQIALRHLMTMTSGLACDENDGDSPGNEGTMQTQTAQPDWYRFTLDLPMQFTPGSHSAYCSAGSNLIGAVLGATSKSWVPALFDRLLAEPLGIQNYFVNLMPTKEMYFGGGVHMRPRDLLKFGQLFLDQGRWKGRRIVSADWVRRSTLPQATASPQSSDGYGWHLYSLTSGGRTFREYEANGNGGQFLIVLPELDLAVVFTAGNYGSYGVWRKFRDELVPRYVIPAVRPPPK